MNPFIGAAKGAKPGFHPGHQPEGGTALLAPGAATNRTVLAHPGQSQVQ